MEASPSRTAMMAAVVRGRHRLEDAPPWILDDPIALELVGPSWRDMAASSDARYSRELGRQLRAAIALRSRYAEHRLELGRFRQYVLLGAGLDSFRWRRPDLLGPLRLFEVDHPASQAWKRERMDELGLATSDDQVFAPVDFEVESLGDGLDAAGFEWGEPTLFSWLGVVPYLTLDAVEATLRTIAGCRSGSEVVFEYGLAQPFMDDLGREFVTGFSRVAAHVGEPLTTGGGWSPAEAEMIVERCGLRVVDHPSRDDLVGRYFGGRTDGLRPWSVSHLMAAAVP
ncbi:MAG: class I SAM-dependent methyltransferase [Acidimicrobiales bacterium]